MPNRRQLDLAFRRSSLAPHLRIPVSHMCIPTDFAYAWMDTRPSLTIHHSASRRITALHSRVFLDGRLSSPDSGAFKVLHTCLRTQVKPCQSWTCFSHSSTFHRGFPKYFSSRTAYPLGRQRGRDFSLKLNASRPPSILWVFRWAPP